MARWIQDPESGRLIPDHEWTRPRHRIHRGPMIMPDIEPFVSPVDGTVVSSRSKLRAHNARNNVVNYHEFDGHWEQQAAQRRAVAEGTDPQARAERIQDIKQAIDHPRVGPRPQED